MSSPNLLGDTGPHLEESKSGKIKIVPENSGFDWRISWYLAFCTLFGGFVHFTAGYDAGVVGGLFTKKTFLARFYPNFRGRKDSPYCTWTSSDLAVYSIMMTPTTIVGCFVCGWVMRKWGRPLGIFLCGFFNIIGAIVQLTAHNSATLLGGRAIIGFGEGFGLFVYNIYLAEIAPAQIRAKVVGTSVTWSASGVLFGQLISYLVNQRADGWKIIIGCTMIPGGLISLASLLMHDTPASLLMRGKKDAARVSLQKYRGIQNVDTELEDMVVRIDNKVSNQLAFKMVFTNKKYWPGVLINWVMYIFLIFTGNTAIVVYGPQVFSLLGLGTQTALWNSLVVGGAKITGVFIGVWLLDSKIVRRKMLVCGGILQTLFLVAAAIIFAFEVPNTKGSTTSKGWAAGILIVIILYEIAFMGGQHVPTLGMAAEVCPVEVRQAIFPAAIFVYGGASIAMSYSFTYMLCAMVWGTFLFFAGLSFLLIIWSVWFMPETHHVPLEHIPEVLAAHPIWKHFYPKAGDTEASTSKGGVALEQFSTKGSDELKSVGNLSGSENSPK